MPAVAHHGVDVGQQGELRHEGLHVDVVGHRAEHVRVGHHHGLHRRPLDDELRQRLDRHPEEPLARHLVHGAQRHEDVAPVGVEPLEGERGGLGSGVGGRAHEHRPSRELSIAARHLTHEGFGGEGDDQVLGEAQVALVRQVLGDAEAHLEVDQGLVDPLAHLGDQGKGLGELCRRRGRGGPGEASAAGGGGPTHGLLVDDEHVGGEGLDGFVEGALHGVGQR